MRYIGMLLIIAAGIGIGLCCAQRLHRRTAFLRRMTRLIVMMEQRMSYAAQPLAVMWRGFAADEMFGDFDPVRQTVARLDEMPFTTALEQALIHAAPRQGLTPTDLGVLQEFVHGCGVTGLEEQRRHLQTYSRLCAQLGDDAAAGAAARAPIYRMMGLAGGVGIALLLL